MSTRPRVTVPVFHEFPQPQLFCDALLVLQPLLLIEVEGGRNCRGRPSSEFGIVPFDFPLRRHGRPAATDRHGGLDVLVNNAGIALVQALVDTSLEQWHRVHAVNLDGVFLGTREAVAAMRPGGRAGRGGSIINISSVGGLIGSERLTAYCSTKGGVRLFSKSVAIECGRAGYGIRVNSVHPGNTDTPMFRRELQDMLDKGMAASLDEARRFFMDMQVLPMIGEPGDVAAMVLFLASDAARFVTGAEFVVDGGLTAQ